MQSHPTNIFMTYNQSKAIKWSSLWFGRVLPKMLETLLEGEDMPHTKAIIANTERQETQVFAKTERKRQNFSPSSHYFVDPQ
jgi:hypothetical protein